ncbi:MAG TPA: SDR family oxidoreductase, partial [Acidimicrobiales bacterium]|nr:SDR family oxidoreductase [Acidimicrobiales bacterium]
GTGGSTGPAGEVVDAIRAVGGEAVANADDVSSWTGSANIIQTAIDAFGKLDVLVNNAGIVRDRMLVSMEEHEIDAVLAVHLKGTLATMRHAANHWRDRAKTGEDVQGRIINTSSGAGLHGSIAQTVYSAAKAGIAAATLVAAAELGRYGVTANAIAPAARTRMTAQAFPDMRAEVEEGQFDAMAPENVSPLVVWLGSVESRDVTGRVFENEGGLIVVADGWNRGPQIDKGARWAPSELGPVVADLLAKAEPPFPVHGT